MNSQSKSFSSRALQKKQRIWLAFDREKDPKNWPRSYDSYALSLSLKSGFHPLKFLSPNLEKIPFFSIHCLSPGKVYKMSEGDDIFDASCDESITYDLVRGLKEEEVPVELADDFNRYWPCLNNRYTNGQFWKYQKLKHGLHAKFEGEFLVKALELGKPLINKLQLFFKYYGYVIGEKHKCQVFIKRLESVFHVKPEIVFVPLENSKNCFRLTTIVFLYNLKLKNLNYGVEDDYGIDSESTFIIEKLDKGRLYQEPAGEGDADAGERAGKGAGGGSGRVSGREAGGSNHNLALGAGSGRRGWRSGTKRPRIDL